ncbi:hypothetical protein ACE2AJ_12035 [Aquihabitans daechungensis]|uniref:hypothetical protein n=1 Tax=Aquihabitans daechungensis TaxID=1052257 RepID=UPI003BA1111F
MELPSHPDADDAEASPRRGRSSGRGTPATIALWTVAAIVLVVIVLHLTGVVGPLSN